MKSRNALITALALGLGLAAPAFAQDAMQDQSTAPTTTDPAATQAPPQAQPADPAAQTSPTQAGTQTSPAQTSPTDPAAAAAGAQPKQVTWSDLDADKDGKLNKTEVASVPALTQVFDDADADKDGALTPDEYKAFVAQNQSDAAAQPQNEG